MERFCPIYSMAPVMAIVWVVALRPLFAPCLAAQTASDRFDLHGKVINVATGEPVSGALVQVSGEFQFSQSDGSFVFTNLPRGQFTVMPRKPGFFNDVELGPWAHGGTAMTTVP